ncbi:MAG: hypothetical protein KVP17_000770 [Porospora cf. gigantea B]|uniref:uncharacterized protein n=1 Tax=Porospora cf. gigantea B TaxID=2853592 RepID=UPI003571D9B3|nr:MAG: hypothetical protein KVP17_000770 [Porospora cf. gigantea B]
MSSCHVQTVEDMRNFSDDLLRRVLKYCGSEKPLYCGLSRTTDHFLQAFEDFLFGTQALNDVLTLTFSWTLVKSGTAHIVVAFAGFMWILVTLILACARPVRHRPRTSPFWREPRAKTSFFRQRLIMLTYCSVILVVVGCVGAAIASVTANAGSLQCCSVGGEWEAVVGDDEGWQGFLNTDVNIRDMQTSYSGSAEDASVIKTLVDTGWAALVEIQGQLLCDSHLLSGFSSFIQLLDRATSLNRLVRLAALATVYILVVAVHLPLLCMACAKKEVSPSRFACLSRLMLSLEILVGLAGGLLLVSFVSHAFVVGWVSVIGDAADQPSLFRQLPAVPQYLADVVPNKVDQERFINTCVGGSGRLIDSMGLQLSDTPDNDRWLAEFDEALDCNDVVGAWLRPLSKFKEK